MQLDLKWPLGHLAKQHPVTHARPASPDAWQDVDARHFEAIEAEIERRAAGGRPGEAPWDSPGYFDIGAPDHAGAWSNVLAVLPHWTASAITQLITMSGLLNTPRTSPTDGTSSADTTVQPKPLDHKAQDLELRPRTRRQDTTVCSVEHDTRTTTISDTVLCH
ncbi:hypothetical protein ACFV6E_13475 [Streptomyces sp. NPDC059785]|uniref:hypothetical protein n=1 Tax=unclassified Streptomyces TaxID=2593676 RepID=UPI0036617A71